MNKTYIKVVFYDLGTIQIIRDTLSTGKCHQQPQVGGRGLAKVSRDIFSMEKG